MEQWVILDIETTGFYPESHRITEIGAIKVIDGAIVDYFSELINPQTKIPLEITRLTGITDEMVKEMPTIEEVLPRFIAYCEGFDIMGHNILFDFSFIKYNAMLQKLKFDKMGVDTLYIARSLLSQLEERSLSYLCEYYSIEREQAHRAYDDANATYTLYKKMKDQFYTEINSALFSPKPIHWKPQKVQPITEKQERYLRHLVTVNNIKLAKPINEFSKSEASRQIDLIINQYGQA